MLEKYSQWIPHKGLSNEYNIKSIKEGYNGLRIRFEHSEDLKPEFLMNFGFTKDYTISHKESRLKELTKLLEKYGDFYKTHNFFVISNSAYFKKIQINSLTLLKEGVTHFHIKDKIFIIDIISFAPRVGIKKRL